MNSQSAGASVSLVLVITIIIILIVEFIFRREIQFNRIESHDLQTRLTFLAGEQVTLVHLFFHVDFSSTFRAGSNRHGNSPPSVR